MEPHDCNFHDSLQVCINDRCPLHRAMRTLAANLATAGALCEAFAMGALALPTIGAGVLCTDVGYHNWFPGCDKPAPNYEPTTTAKRGMRR